MLSYFGNAEATAAAFTEDGFLRTGDLGYTEEGSGFVFLARMGDVLRLGGFLVSPAEIEATLLELPGIADCQVVAVATPAGNRPVAFVIMAPGAALDEARALAHCRARIAGYKVPARLVRLDAFPVTQSANGTKIQRTRLRAMAEEAMKQEARS
jgi:fatty-acyl-CoA synthase